MAFNLLHLQTHCCNRFFVVFPSLSGLISEHYPRLGHVCCLVHPIHFASRSTSSALQSALLTTTLNKAQVIKHTHKSHHPNNYNGSIFTTFFHNCILLGTDIFCCIPERGKGISTFPKLPLYCSRWTLKKYGRYVLKHKYCWEYLNLRKVTKQNNNVMFNEEHKNSNGHLVITIWSKKSMENSALWMQITNMIITDIFRNLFTADVITVDTVMVRLGLSQLQQNTPSIGILMHSPQRWWKFNIMCFFV
jgi:hypothetical protein